MIALDKLYKKLQIVLGDVPTTEMQWQVSFADDDAWGSKDGVTDGTTVVDMCTGIQGTPSPTIYGVRKIANVSVFNADSAAHIVSIIYYDGTLSTRIVKVTLTEGYTLHYDSDGWYVTDASGRRVNVQISVVSLPSLTDGKIWVGDAANEAQEQTPSGDVTMTNAGVFSLVASINKAITGVWSFVSEKISIKNGSFAHVFKSLASSNQTWTLPDEGDQVFASRAYAEALVTGLWDDRGTFDASVNAYPSSGGSGSGGAILKGDIWTISVAGTLPTGQTVEPGDTVRALVDTPGNTQSNWAIAQNNIGYVAENQANKVSSISASATEYPNNNAVIAYAQPLDADLTVIAGLSPSNDDIIQRKSGAWINRTLAQYYADLQASVKADVFVSTVLSFTSISPADSTTYYIGYAGIPRTTQTDRDFPYPVTGTITDIDFYHVPTGVNGSADASTLYFENITQATSVNLGTFNITQGANVLRTSSFSGLSIAVTKGDNCVLRWDSAAWATNPTNVIGGANIICKRA